MNSYLAVFVAALCCSIRLYGQAQTSPNVPFAGCYEIVSQTWHPGNEDASPVPSRFQLGSEQADKRSTDFFQMRDIPTGRNDWERLWLWRPRGDRLWLSWGRGLGGFRGTLKQQRDGEFVGQIKEWCDSRVRVEKTGSQNPDSENRVCGVIPRNWRQIPVTHHGSKRGDAVVPAAVLMPAQASGELPKHGLTAVPTLRKSVPASSTS
jgi:hypothetical protein